MKHLVVAASLAMIGIAGGRVHLKVDPTETLKIGTTGFSTEAPVQQENRTLTSVGGLKVGHHTLSERLTGCTVVVAEAGAVAGVDVRGGAPGTRETDLLNPTNLVQQVHAIVLSGGSAFGLAAADGAIKYLEERYIGFPFGGRVIPIVPAAILFDLSIGDGAVRPGPDCGYAAARSASTAPVAEGNVGAGAGATVGKWLRADRGMKGGIGSAAISLPDGLVVGALVAVNAAGNVIDPVTGRFIAGGRTDDGGSIADLRALLRGRSRAPATPGGDTTLAVVATNATLTKVQATKLAQMAHDGYARALYPAHLTVDGDIVFALATGARTGAADLDQLGALAADAVADAIVRAARAATGIPGYPAARDMK